MLSIRSANIFRTVARSTSESGSEQMSSSVGSNFEWKDDLEVLPDRDLEETLRRGLRKYNPVLTKLGARASFFLNDSGGQRIVVFKPMSMQLSQSVVANEVLAYALDHKAFGGHYGIPKTSLVRLAHTAFMGDELGCAQQFIPNAHNFAEIPFQMRANLPQTEWEKLNFKLISGCTDAHEGNVLFRDGKLYLVSCGNDFVDRTGQREYDNPWIRSPRARIQMSPTESSFLKAIDIQRVMLVFEQVSLENEQKDPRLKVSVDKYLTQVLRLYLAKMAGKYQLSQLEWFSLITPKKNIYGRSYAGELESIYEKHIKDKASKSDYWRAVSSEINWFDIYDKIEMAVCELVKRRSI